MPFVNPENNMAFSSISRIYPVKIATYRSPSIQAQIRSVPTALIQRRFKSDKSTIRSSSPLNLDRSNKFHIGVKIIPQGSSALVERFGKFHKLLTPGLHFLVPIVDRISYSFPLQRVSFQVDPQQAFTKDNIRVELGGDIVVRITNSESAAYGAKNPFSLATIYAQAAMRNAVGELTLDELLNQREAINRKVFEAVNKHTKDYGLECLGYEIKGLQVPDHIEEEMARQVTSERKRRETVLNSQGEREASINKAEGNKTSAQLNSEGDKIAKINEAEGNAKKRLIEAQAEAEALKIIGNALRENPEAASVRLASEALKIWSGMLGKSNTMIIPANTNPLEALLPQALAAYTRSNTIFDATVIHEPKKGSK